MANEQLNESNGLQKSRFEGVALTGGTFSNYEQYCFTYKMAKELQQAQMVPKRYQGNIGDCLIALDMASRLGANPIMVMQNLYVVNGMPAWSGQFVIAAINTSGRFDGPLRFNVDGSGNTLSCVAYAKNFDGEIIEGTTITMEMARKEGWLSKSGSKWQSMPEQMIRYRAASFFGRLYCPDILMGIYTEDEVLEIEPEYFVEKDSPQTPDQTEKEIKQKANQKALDFDTVIPFDMQDESPQEEVCLDEADNIEAMSEKENNNEIEQQQLFDEPSF